jgi:hypothetical protein
MAPVSRNDEVVIIFTGETDDHISGIAFQDVNITFDMLQGRVLLLSLPQVIEESLPGDLGNLLVDALPRDPGFIAFEKIGMGQHMYETDVHIEAVRKIEAVIDDLFPHMAEIHGDQYLSGHCQSPPG